MKSPFFLIVAFLACTAWGISLPETTADAGWYPGKMIVRGVRVVTFTSPRAIERRQSRRASRGCGAEARASRGCGNASRGCSAASAPRAGCPAGCPCPAGACPAGCPAGGCPGVQSVRPAVESYAPADVRHAPQHRGPTWTWPGDLREHLRSSHGAAVDGMNQAELVELHDAIHNSANGG